MIIPNATPSAGPIPSQRPMFSVAGSDCGPESGAEPSTQCDAESDVIRAWRLGHVVLDSSDGAPEAFGGRAQR